MPVSVGIAGLKVTRRVVEDSIVLLVFFLVQKGRLGLRNILSNEEVRA